MQVDNFSNRALDSQPVPFSEPKGVSRAKVLSIDINLAPFLNQRINVEFPYTPIIETAKNFFSTAYQQFPETATVSTAWLALNMIKSPLSIGVIPVMTAGIGALIGGGVSYLVRHLTGEAPLKLGTTGEHLQKLVSSKTLLAAVGTAAAIGVMTTLPAIIINSTPYLVGGILTHHTLDYLHENQVIDESLKSSLQKATVAVSSFFALQSVISQVSTLVIGAAIGSVIESQNVTQEIEE